MFKRCVEDQQIKTMEKSFEALSKRNLKLDQRFPFWKFSMVYPHREG